MKRLPPSRRPAAGLPAVVLAMLAFVLAGGTPATAANHLAGQSSPYLLEHADNPVDWYPWGTAALDRAKREDKPIFLSIGYSACHWCHVMEKESFSDPEIAGLLNEAFVSIKVDREERPDLDALYMNAVIAMTGGGGWPMSVFLTPDLRPFHAGTYYPKARFRELVGSVGLAWRSERARLLDAATMLRDAMAEIQKTRDDNGTDTPETDLVALATQAFAKDFDAEHGGFGKAPKFPPHGALLLLLRADREGDARALRMADATLLAMERGGLRDQIGGGFHRYTVDAAWRVPHFEKMLSDNALLVPIYLMAWKQTGREEFRQVAEETIAFAEREMSDPAGGFITSLDADTDGEEGRYYTFTPAELAAALPAADRDWVAEYYGVTPKGDARGRSVLAPTGPDEAFAKRHDMTAEALRTRLGAAKKALLQARSRRTPPHRDDKVLTAWNGLMLTALSTAHVATKDPAHLARARKTADFALKELVDPQGRPYVSWRRGRTGPAGFLDDSAFLVRGLLDLYGADPDKRWLSAAVALTKDAGRFADPSGGWFFAVDTPDLIVRPRSLDDSSLPAGNAIMVENLARLAHLTGDIGALQDAGRTVDRAAAVMRAAPTAHPYLILARDSLYQARAAGPAANAAVAPGLLTRPALAAEPAAA
ncbi:MAG TPA: thioredoxin domain-containing protein, partial [Candidatus Polarisedimenticolia bacterium]|nr:thioredoxin domain-containing protein [Candidatus Polarisedimenticolia bacterium]